MTWEVVGGNKLALHLPRPLARGPARLRLRFAGRLDAEKSRGLYRAREPDGSWYAYTMFEPVDARRAFPCFDEPGYKIPWELTLRVPPGDVAVANTPLASEALEGGRRVFRFRESKPLSSYLVAFVTGPFDVIDAGKAGHHDTPLRFVVPRGRAGELGYARQVTPKIVGLLEEYFDDPYPFGKLDVAVVPRYGGTMEHPGIVALGQPLTLIKPAEETTRRRQWYANIAVHELGHYWFGNVVTAAWWDDTWLNEGLTTWLDRKITDRVDPAWHFGNERITALETALSSDALPSAKPLRLPVTSAEAIEASFDGENTYMKGASVIGMLEHWVGEATWRRTMQRYLRAHAWGSATSEDFLRAVSTEAGAPAAEALRTFLERSGAPSIAAELRCQGGKASLALSQRRYRPLGLGAKANEGANEGAKPTLWKVPVCVRYPAGGATKSTCHLLEGEAAEVPLEAPGCPEWVVLNDGAAGYYRSAYAAPAREKLRARASRVLSVPERALFVGDVRAQVAAGEADLSAALELSATFAGEADRKVFGTSSEPLRDVKSEFLSPPQQAAYGRALRRLYGTRARSLGWLPKPGESDDAALTRAWLLPWLATAGRDDALQTEARTIAEAWLAGKKQLPLELVRSLLFAAAPGGDAGFFDRLVAAAEANDDRERRSAIFGALGIFADGALLDRAFALAENGRFDAREAYVIWLSSLYHPRSRDRAWASLRPRLDAVFGSLRDRELASLMVALGSFCDRGRRAELEAELRPRVARFGGTLVLDKALERLDICAEARARQQPAVEAFLRRY
ncbi:MAG: M1 family metallopeptidase [Polyangiaceae bacterium]|nr:M1 family metallopeptidase [Polyangiaceae bacterium]